VKPLVVLRPEPGASATASRARKLGLDARTMSLFEVVPLSWTAPDPTDFDALVITSTNAVRHGGAALKRLMSLPVYAVGEATAAAARAAGFVVATTGEGGVRDMALPSDQKLLHLSGRDHLPIDAATTIAVYEARPIQQPEGLDALDGCVAVVHSPRAGRRLGELVSERSGIAIAAISPAAAEACGDGWTSVDAAAEPTDSALLALAARLCDSLVR